MADAFPDYDVLSCDFSHSAITGNTENENAYLPCDIAPGIDLDGMKFINFHPGIDSALPEGLNGRTPIDTCPTGREKSGIFTVEIGNGCAIPGIEGSHKLNHSFIDVCAGFAGH